MERTNRRALLLGLLLFPLLTTGCPSPERRDGAAPGPVATGSASATNGNAGAFRAALVLDTAGVDDKSFNASAWAGMQKAIKDFGVEGKYVESKTAADFKPNLIAMAGQKPDLVFAVGFAMEDAVKSVAAQFPDVKFAIVDGSSPEGASNVVALKFKEEEGTFLAGYLAASVSKAHKIGFVSGMDLPIMKKFEAGYRAGAKMAHPDTAVLASYTGDWNDVSKGKSQAIQQFANGADIIFHAAGKAGLGVIQAAKEKGPGFYAMGVDRDQDGEAPGRVLASMLKRIDNVVYATVKDTKDGQFKSGTKVYGFDKGGVGLSEMRFTKKDIPIPVLSRLEKVQAALREGKIKPPTKVEDVATFQPPSLR